MTKSWDELRKEFRMVVLKRGPVTVAEMAERMHIGRRTVFRLMKGDVTPRTSVRQCVESYVNEHRQENHGPD